MYTVNRKSRSLEQNTIFTIVANFSQLQVTA